MIHDKKTEKLEAVYDLLYGIYGECECPLVHKNHFELLVAVILSAQCTDKRVNIITPELFRVFGTPEKMASAAEEEVIELIKTAGLAKSKAKNIDLFSRLLNLLDMHEVEFIWVKGHAGHTENERCDHLATSAILKDNLSVDEGFTNEE